MATHPQIFQFVACLGKISREFSFKNALDCGERVRRRQNPTEISLVDSWLVIDHAGLIVSSITADFNERIFLIEHAGGKRDRMNYVESPLW